MSQHKSGTFFEKLATFIVEKRNLFFLLFVFAVVFSFFSMGWVNVENDVTTYLSEESET
jgi:predicted RND superfamily exporter protein